MVLHKIKNLSVQNLTGSVKNCGTLQLLYCIIAQVTVHYYKEIGSPFCLIQLNILLWGLPCGVCSPEPYSNHWQAEMTSLRNSMLLRKEHAKGFSQKPYVCTWTDTCVLTMCLKSVI